MYLIDTNIFLEILLKQQKQSIAFSFLDSVNSKELFISDLSIFSIGIILFNLKEHNLFTSFENDIKSNGTSILSLIDSDLTKLREIALKYNIDFDDSYQYLITKKYNLNMVSFDKDFDKTDIKRIEPGR